MNDFLARRRSIWIAASLAVAVALSHVSALVAQPPTAPAGEMKTVAVIAATSYDDLIGDINFVGSLADRPELGQMVEGMIGMFTQFKGLVGVDKTRPWGVILETDGQQFLPIGCLPVTDVNELLGLVQGFGMQIRDGANGTKEIPLPNEQTLFVKPDGNWAFVAQTAEHLTRVPADPQAVLGQLVDDYDLGARISAQNVPEAYRQLALQAMKSGMEDGLQRKADESDEEYEMRRQMAETQMEQLERMILEIDEVTIGWALDAGQQRSYLDFIYRFLPDSKMSRQLTAYGQPRTNFAGFYQPQAAATLTFASKADPELIKEDLDQMRSMFQTMRKQAEKAIDEEEDIPDDATREAIKGALADFMDAFQATMESGQMDGGAALHLRPNSLSLVAGAMIQEPAKFESGLKKLAAVAEKEPNFNGIQWNAATHAGVNFHTLTVPVPEGEDARKILGEKVDVAIGIGSDAIYVAVGPDNLNAINQAIDASRAEPGKEVPPFELSIALGPIMAMAATHADDDQRPMLQAIADMLHDQAQGRDHIRMTGALIENGLRYRIEVEEGVLRAIGKASTMAQQRAMQ